MNMNVSATEEQIRTLAYRLWEEAGCPDGQSDEFWILAQQKLASEPGMAAVEGEAMEKTPLAVDSKT
jgi:hypothetical protein